MIPILTSNLDEISARHYNSVRNHLINPRLKFSYTRIDNWFKSNGSCKSFQDVILADSKELIDIKDSYKNCIFPDEINYIKNSIYTYYFANAKKGLGKENYSAANLVDSLGIKVCPYCNKNYINNIKYSSKGVKRTCQIDHFYCKEKYPFLAISFYNLIPSCATCNHIKSNLDLSYSPYNQENSNNLGTFNFKIKSLDFLYNVEFIDIVFNCAPILQKNKNLLHLEAQYEIHKDVIQEIYKKKLIYSDSKINEIYNDFKGLFRSKEELLNLIYSYDSNEEDYLKKPLSKLKQNIFDII